MRARLVPSLLALGLAASCAEPTSFKPTPPTLPAPRLPMNNAYLGSIHDGRPLRPRFVWEASTAKSSDPIRYELQLSREASFTTVLDTIETSDTSYQPDADLEVRRAPPVGERYFWRLRACVLEQCSEYTRPWYLNLGRAIKDYNGDGYSDIAVGAPGSDSLFTNAGRVFVYFGGPDGPRDVPDRLMGNYDDLSPNGGAGRTVQAAGDVNGDGYADLFWAIPAATAGGEGRASLFLGGAGDAFDGIHDTKFATGIPDDGFAVDGGGVGDVNGDGFDDVFIASSGSTPRVEVYFGEPGMKMDAKADGVFPYGNVAGGDLNGDGLAEMLIGNIDDDTGGEGAGAAYVFLGSAEASLTANRVATFVGRGAFEAFGTEVSFVGDVDGDGFGDVVVGNLKNADTGGGVSGSADLFLGGNSIDARSAFTWRGTVRNDSFGVRVAGAGDVNGDGYGDLVVGAPSSLPGGMSYLFQGAPRDRLAQTASLTLTGATENSLGSAVSGAGDVNGDGFADFAIGAYGHSAYAGRVDVFLGGAALDATPAVVLHGAASDYFGTGLASLLPRSKRASRASISASSSAVSSTAALASPARAPGAAPTCRAVAAAARSAATRS